MTDNRETPGPRTPEDWRRYWEERERVVSEFAKPLRSTSERAYEYGVLALRSLLIICGGALVAIPTVAGIFSEFPVNNSINLGACFATALLFTILAIYATHWNWMLNYEATDLSRDQHLNELYESFGFHGSNQESTEKIRKDIARLTKRVEFTLYLPHLFGVLSYMLFFAGCIVLFSGLMGS
jgi:hypothetical protein